MLLSDFLRQFCSNIDASEESDNRIIGSFTDQEKFKSKNKDAPFQSI